MTQGEIDALVADIATLEASLNPELRTAHDGRSVEFRSVDEILKMLSYKKGLLAAATSTVGRRVNFTDAPRQKGWT